ncbi:unnamed protein product [Urochloa humidicola]
MISHPACARCEAVKILDLSPRAPYNIPIALGALKLEGCWDGAPPACRAQTRAENIDSLGSCGWKSTAAATSSLLKLR